MKAVLPIFLLTCFAVLVILPFGQCPNLAKDVGAHLAWCHMRSAMSVMVSGQVVG